MSGSLMDIGRGDLTDAEWERLSKRASLEYQWELSVAPGWKAGGWPAEFTFRNPTMSCAAASAAARRRRC